MKSERLRTLKAELDADMKILEGLEAKYKKAKEKLKRIEPDELDFAGLVYTIANIYNLMENYFLCVAKGFENAIEFMKIAPLYHALAARKEAARAKGIDHEYFGIDKTTARWSSSGRLSAPSHGTGGYEHWNQALTWIPSRS